MFSCTFLVFWYSQVIPGCSAKPKQIPMKQRDMTQPTDRPRPYYECLALYFCLPHKICIKKRNYFKKEIISQTLCNSNLVEKNKFNSNGFRRSYFAHSKLGTQAKVSSMTTVLIDQLVQIIEYCRVALL